MHSALTDVLNRCREVILTSSTQSAPEAQEGASKPARPPTPTARPAEPPQATVRALSSLPSAEQLAEGKSLSTGAAKVWCELHRLARHVQATRATRATPDAVTFHLPAVILAALVEYSERHTYRLLAELAAAGLLDYGGHVGVVGKLRRYTGTLFSVPMKPGARPRLRYWDWQADWRPDFEADYHGEAGAWREVQAVMSEPLTLEGKQARLWGLAKHWAAGSRTQKIPLRDGSDMRQGGSFQAVASSLPDLVNLHPRQRHRRVSEMGATLAALLSEPHRLKQWCGAIYRALAAENEGRAGLAALAHELYRFGAEMRQGETATMRNMGAVLAARVAI